MESWVQRSTTMKSSLSSVEGFLHLPHADPIHFIPHRITLLAVYRGSIWLVRSGWLVSG